MDPHRQQQRHQVQQREHDVAAARPDPRQQQPAGERSDHLAALHRDALERGGVGDPARPDQGVEHHGPRPQVPQVGDDTLGLAELEELLLGPRGAAVRPEIVENQHWGGPHGVEDFVVADLALWCVGRTQVVEQAGRVAARGFHRLIIKEDGDLRGRQSGEIAALLYQAAQQEMPAGECRIVLDEAESGNVKTLPTVPDVQRQMPESQ